MRRKMIALLFVLFVFFTLFGLLYFWSALRPPKLISRTIPKDLGLEYESVSFRTADNLTLKGWFIPRQSSGQVPSLRESAKTIVLLHGYPADKGNILPFLAFLKEKYNLFLFDFRYLGESEGQYSTAGAKEREDLKAAIRYLRSRGVTEVGVWGFSMGGAVALMTAHEVPEIRAIVSDSAYSRLDLMVPRFFRGPIRFLGWTFLGIDLKKISPAESIRGLSIPILIIHSKDDQVISFRHALLLQEALERNPLAEFWFTEGLHGQLEESYRVRIEDFFRRNL